MRLKNRRKGVRERKRNENEEQKGSDRGKKKTKEKGNERAISKEKKDMKNLKREKS